MMSRLPWCWLLAAALGAAENPRTAGLVTAVDAAGARLTVRTDEGAQRTVALAQGAEILSVPAEARDLKNARRITLAEIQPGDRILARGEPAVTLLVMSRSEVERKRAAERADWERRGISGVITDLDAGARTLTLRTQTLSGAQPLVVELGEEAVLRRYAPGSVKFSDARPCRFEDFQPGDQVRARGERRDERFLAEEVVAGAFRTVAAQVEALQAQTRALRVKDLESGRRLTIELGPDSRLRRMPEAMARMLAARLAGGGRPAARGATQGPPGSPAPGAGPPGLEALLERLPEFKLEDLKPGDAIVVSSTRGADPSRLTAITLLAGVEPLLEAQPPQNRQAWLESWNLDLNMNVGW
jgi:hypothetical protein